MARRPLWVEIGGSLALLTVAASLLNGGVYLLATRGARTDAASALAEASASVIAPQLAATDRSAWSGVVEAHQRRSPGTITVWGPEGAVLAGRARSAPAEVRAAWATREGVLRADADGAEALVPVGAAGRPTEIVGVSVPLARAVDPAWLPWAAHGLFSAASIAVFGFVVLRSNVLRPLTALRQGTSRIAGGDFGARVSEDAPTELAELAVALNRMSAALAEYRARTAEQVGRLEAANTELRAAQDALVRTERLASVGRLAAGLAHELGNPLSAVRGYVELLVMDAGGGRPIDAALLERASVEVERMHGLIRGLLDFARQESPAVVTASVEALLEDAARTVRPRASFRTVRIDVRASAELTVRVDPSRIQQVLVNLLLNAADAGARHVELAAEACADGVSVSCADDGHGIPAELVERVFEPFFTTRPPGAGTGLGLAVAHRIVEEHGGRLEVCSASGHGATFRLVLPGGPVRGAPSA
jgi:two-component system NtrC family sensor kinase